MPSGGCRTPMTNGSGRHQINAARSLRITHEFAEPLRSVGSIEKKSVTAGKTDEPPVETATTTLRVLVVGPARIGRTRPARAAAPAQVRIAGKPLKIAAQALNGVCVIEVVERAVDLGEEGSAAVHALKGRGLVSVVVLGEAEPEAGAVVEEAGGAGKPLRCATS